MPPDNIFANIPDDLSEELFTTLVDGRMIKVERIVSQGHGTEEAQWYDQHWHEWVIVLEGSARLRIKDQDGERLLVLNKGDHLVLPAHCRHRVESTHSAEKTVWLAVHFAPDD